MKKFTVRAFSLFISAIILTAKFGYSQNTSSFSYINPLPNAQFVSINSGIIIRHSNIIEKSSINNDIIEVVGSKSGLHNGRLILANDSQTLIFQPTLHFQTDENVSVKLRDGILTENGVKVGQLEFKFHTSINANVDLNQTEQNIYKSQIPKNSVIIEKLTSTNQIPDSSLPLTLPKVDIKYKNNPTPGYFFMSASPYLEIVDNEGTPVFYRYVGGHIYDFNLQPNGQLTYFIYPVSCYGLDSSYNLVQTFSTADSFSVDVHELYVLPDGGYFIFGKRLATIDLTEYGGYSNASIIDGALQEFDSSGNLIFEWDALEHYYITDIDELDANTQLNQMRIDFSHFNSIDFDTDTTILISARNLDEITKINRKTGDIIWRLGGKNNEFTFINDDIGFSRQHDIRKLSNGNISIFDNGTYHPKRISSAVEYKLDEVNKTVTMVRRIYHNNIYTETEGSVQELENGNKVISWGHNWNPVITEIKPNDTIAIDLSYQKYIDTYRAFKYKWKTNLFTTNIDSLNFGFVSLGDSLTKQFVVYNPQDSAITINEFYCSDSSFSTNIQVPITIMPGDSLIVHVTFKPIINDTFSVSFNIRDFGEYNGLEQMIARQVILYGTSEDISLVNSNSALLSKYILYQNYPNPFNPNTTISYQLPRAGKVILKVFDVLGNEITTLVNMYKPAGNYEIDFDASYLPSSVYFYQLKVGSYIESKKMILLK